MSTDNAIPEANIRYTTDGRDPTAKSASYTKRFSVNVSALMTVKSAVFLGGVRIGAIAVEKYSPILDEVLDIGSIIAKDGSAPLEFDLDDRRQWWIDSTETSFDGTPSMKSGKIGSEETSWMSATFTGAGIFEFSWKASCEEDELGEFYYDHAICELDGEEVAWLDGVTGWVTETIAVEGLGEHTIVWSYTKDVDDDQVYPGEDCVWVDGVKFSYPVTVSFAAGEAAGEAPAPIMSSIGYEVALPSQGDLAFARHRFAGWSDGVSIYDAGESYRVGSENVTMTAVWEAKELSAPTISCADSYDEESTAVEISLPENADAVYYTVDGSDPAEVTGTLYNGPFLFDFKGTLLRQDGMSLLVDGVEMAYVNGETGWTNCIVSIEGTGPHVVRWVYSKDSGGAEGADCAWLDYVSWIPFSASDLIPVIDADAMPDEVAHVIETVGFADMGVKAAIGGSANQRDETEHQLLAPKRVSQTA